MFDLIDSTRAELSFDDCKRDIAYPLFMYLALINCIPRTKYVRGILWFSRRYAASAAASADTSSFSR